MKNKVKTLNIITVVSMVLSSFFFIKNVLEEGIEQVPISITVLYVLAIVVSIASFVLHWMNKQNKVSNLHQ
ncbi:hypothetical protein ACIQZG_21190 [Lysinibacillus sp. NPDC096418]|uniref:hypothetical protein n=1 Tax=Lysinibacillus sp. NPDC096418 TaxID=3364138 RepID=UPI0038209353